jgi:hypothetical protein
MAWIQIPEERLVLETTHLERLELVRGLSIHSGGNRIDQVVGYAPFYAVYLVCRKTPDAIASIPLFVGVNLPGRLHEFLADTLHLEIDCFSAGTFEEK